MTKREPVSFGELISSFLITNSFTSLLYQQVALALFVESDSTSVMSSTVSLSILSSRPKGSDRIGQWRFSDIYQPSPFANLIYNIAAMASPEIYQDGKKTEGGFWRFLAIGITIGAVLALINDMIAVNLSRG